MNAYLPKPGSKRPKEAETRAPDQRKLPGHGAPGHLRRGARVRGEELPLSVREHLGEARSLHALRGSLVQGPAFGVGRGV